MDVRVVTVHYLPSDVYDVLCNFIKSDEDRLFSEVDFDVGFMSLLDACLKIGISYFLTGECVCAIFPIISKLRSIHSHLLRIYSLPLLTKSTIIFCRILYTILSYFRMYHLRIMKSSRIIVIT
jgi:hypothetical protein